MAHDPNKSLRERMATIEADFRWLKWLVLGNFLASVGHYFGFDGSIAQAFFK